MRRTLSLGISPCPNDTYIFAGLITGRVATGAFFLNTSLLDIQELNEQALEAAFDLVKISIAVYPRIMGTYRLLGAGAALGRGCGPLLLSARPLAPASLRSARLAVPGTLTTANLLLQKTGLHQGELLVMRYDLIMEAIRAGQVDAGVIIHEGRFTYPEYGLIKVLDLGQWWEDETGLPIPLGGIAMRRSLGTAAADWAEGAIRTSLDFADRHIDALRPYIRRHAQEMDESTITAHIRTFVNAYTRDLGTEGRRAIRELLGISEADLDEAPRTPPRDSMGDGMVGRARQA